MFNKILRQNNKELRKTIFDLETSIDFKNDLIQNQKEEIKHLKYNLDAYRFREQIWEDERKQLNNIISTAYEQINKLTAKNIEIKRKIEADNHDKATSI